ncbi:MAG TPA: aquaporin, partial [Acidimicrobiia bacterium]|nr:aquaporin [Acidimicrobiia bacterium]
MFLGAGVGGAVLLTGRLDRELARRLAAEAVGTAFLVAIVVGSGIAAQRLSPGQTGLQLFINAAITGAGLVALILALGPISGGHFNPVVTLADRILGGISTRSALAYATVQVIGACVGAIVANLMFDLPAVTLSTHSRGSSG